MRFYLSIFLTLSVPIVSWAQGTRAKPQSLPVRIQAPKDSIEQFGDVTHGILSRMPDGDVKKGLQQYADILNTKAYKGDGDVGGGNEGIGKWFESQSRKGSCFQRLSTDFYNKINAIDISRQRPSLSSTANKSSRNQNEGWLWKMALSESGNNPNLAMTLIGMCGHDDTNQGHYGWYDNSPAGQDKAKLKISALNQTIADFKIQLAKLEPGSKATKTNLRKIDTLSRQIEGLKTKGIWENLQCPAQGFYTPGSLGASVDIDQDLKEKIASIQAPTKGASVLPAKHYHVYGAAFMACQMIEKGMPKILAPQIEEQAARAYRGVRVCTDVDDALGRFNMYKDMYEQEKKSNESLEEFIRRKSTEVGLTTGMGGGMPSPGFGLMSGFGFGAKESKEALANKIEASIEKQAAAYLYHRWYVGSQKLGKMTVPCTDRKILTSVNILEMNFKDKCVPGFSEEMCEKAKARLQTWEVDFDWTAAQHKVGAEFAAKNCTKRTETTEQMSCKALAQSGATSSSAPRGGVR